MFIVGWRCESHSKHYWFWRPCLLMYKWYQFRTYWRNIPKFSGSDSQLSKSCGINCSQQNILQSIRSLKRLVSLLNVEETIHKLTVNLVFTLLWCTKQENRSLIQRYLRAFSMMKAVMRFSVNYHTLNNLGNQLVFGRLEFFISLLREEPP